MIMTDAVPCPVGLHLKLSGVGKFADTAVLIQRFHVMRQQAVQAKLRSLAFGKCRAFIQNLIVQ